jgi:diguanylate cyclase (GGDEF)-like protein
MSARCTVLVVAPGEIARELAPSVEAGGYTVLCQATASDAIAVLMERRMDALVVFRELSGESGLAVIEHIRETGGIEPVVLLSSAPTPGLVAEGLRAGADDVCGWPLGAVELVARLERRLAAAKALAEARGEVQQLRELAVTDGLTGVANHRAFQERLREEFLRAQRYDVPLSLVLADVDHFKQVNDTWGHQVGDEVLRAMSGCIRGAVRETDFVARYGGEEFGVLLPNTQLSGALTVAERISQGLRAMTVGPESLRITASFGVSTFPSRQVTSAEQLVKTADEALYRAKAEGRNKISLAVSASQLRPN